jgi:TrmH family RNA methyltransferase
MKKLLISAENAEFQVIESLKNNRTKRAGNNEIFIEGIESIKQAFKAGLEITRIITMENISPWAKEIIGGFKELAGLKIIVMSDCLYRKLCDRSDPSEMLVTAKMPKPQLGEVALPEKPFVLVLDRPSDTGNLGSIIRSANSFGVDAVLYIGHGVDPWDPKTIRSSLGSIFFTTPIQMESMEEFVNFLESIKGTKVWGTDSGGDLTLDTCVLQRPLVLILGNEAKGMSQTLKAVCDGIISIPVTGAVNSLNIASAASIFMWEVFKGLGVRD